ncbi:UBA domain-containing protein [Trichinella spiralis]|uniref:UBA domain-containing protein n=1 Tax=Trichinella spiralis TaxID=6334 RepID=A0ABR3KF21_TRISP
MLCSNIFFNMRLLSCINLFTYFFFLFIAAVQGFGIAERLVNITVERCPDAAGSENRPRPCITAFTRPSVRPDSIAEFSWVRHSLEPSSICTVQFAGQQGIYKLSPDVGPHPQCSSVLSTFRHRLASVMGQTNVPAIRFQPFHQNQCPIRELPLDYNQYLACTSVQTDQWYLFRFATEATPPSEQWFLEFVTLNPRLSVTANNSVNFLTTYRSNQCQWTYCYRSGRRVTIFTGYNVENYTVHK